MDASLWVRELVVCEMTRYALHPSPLLLAAASAADLTHSTVVIPQSIFGANAIEPIPPRSDDAPRQPAFPVASDADGDRDVPPRERLRPGLLDLASGDGQGLLGPGHGRVCRQGMAEVFRQLPRIDAVFVPEGDSGDAPPKHSMALIEKQAASLKKYHPTAAM